MGTSIESLHILKRNDPEKITHDVVAEAVLKILEQQSYHEVDSEKDADRGYYVASKNDCDWISVYNADLTKSIDFTFYGELEKLGSPLAATLSSPIVQVAVHDSDVIILRLFEDGSLIDTFSDWINFERLPKKQVGNAEKWGSVLPENITPDDLEKTWKPNKADYPFESEGILNRVADLLQMDEELSHLDGSDFAGIEEDDSENDDDGMWVTLIYIKKGT